MTHTISEKGFRSGYITIVGPPNAGKSTLLNRFLGQKISIISQKPQTTRNRILGVVHRTAAQLIFIDTPGIHRTATVLNARIVETALSAVRDADLILLIVDASSPDPASEEILIASLQDVRIPVILALNKIDRIEKGLLLPQMETWSQKFSFAEIIPISAEKGLQVERLLQAIETRLPQGPPFFPEDVVTDVTERFVAAEIVREKVFRFTGQEIPYSTAVTVDSYVEEPEKPMVRIHASIHVERDSQKGIVIGRGGQKLRQIGEAARTELEGILDCKVFLKLYVRVQENWSKDPKALRRFGYG